MTLKTRIIPCLDVKDGRVVKGVQFVDLVDAGDPVEAAIAYDAAGADELCFLDITASSEGRDTIFDVVARTAEHCFMPVTVGGGIRKLEDIRKLLLAGADKVSINTAAVNDPGFRGTCRRQVRRPVHRCVGRCPAAADAGGRWPQRLRVGDLHPWRPQRDRASMRWSLRCAWSSAGRGSCSSPRWIATAPSRVSISTLTRAIADAVHVPVIASGGVGTLDDLVDGVKEGHASAVLAASIFHFGTFTIAEAKAHLQQHGIAMRNDAGDF